ncbi:non-ribosomal peptide synthetase [Lacrimispora sp.]|uniref:non-ribosomal peptide synthetase n=1 Tax=Lacrimispora sp. TaxID=2719234 RepID=UPI0028A9D820|nr:amino acid adenylation domain-containing protein [Lacrimispora sp.]
MRTAEKTMKILGSFTDRGITLFVEAGKLKYRTPKGKLTQEDMELLKANKESIIQYLGEHDSGVCITAAPEDQYKPFPLTDVQAAYALGRKDTFEYGGVACHVYMELGYEKLDAGKVQDVWNQLIVRHEMLRAVVFENGIQQVLPAVKEFRVQEHELYGADEPEERLSELRDQMGNAKYELGNWPMFGIAVSHLNTGAILHFSMEFLIADWKSIWMLLAEFETLYFSPEQQLPEVNVSFRDYLIAEKKLKSTERYTRDREYWRSRIDTLPGAPGLPPGRSMDMTKPRFTRYFLELDNERWTMFKENARHFGITATAAVLTVYAQVLERWSRTSEFCLNLTVLNREPLHPEVGEIVGDFTSVSLLEVTMKETDIFVHKAKIISRQLFEDLDHRLFNGVEVIREIARTRGREQALMPIVFTSAIGISDKKLKGEFHGNGISQTPQVFIDCQVMDGAYGLQADWDVREGVFPDGLIPDMFRAFEERLVELADKIELWTSVSDVPLPMWQQTLIDDTNGTAALIPSETLYDRFVINVHKQPEKIAVIDSDGKFTYAQLHDTALGIARLLQDKGIETGSNVAILMKKGRYQAAAAMGILYAGCTYIPIDIEQPVQRQKKMEETADVKAIVSLSEHDPDVPDRIILINADEAPDGVDETIIRRAGTDEVAYIIYTSGTTGIPKGVAISHEAAFNTIDDINKRFSITAQDSVLGLSKLNFDLSVYDIFGMLSCGGTLIYPSVSRYMDPSCWLEIILQYGITVWNTVPAFMQMLLGYLKDKEVKMPFKAVLLSGDWIPVSMPDEIWKFAFDTRIISLGGATEAAIWSIYHECDRDEAKRGSIPYGKPLSNQGLTVLDHKGRTCPVYVTGELVIFGKGLADGYYNDTELTKEKFVTDSNYGKCYRTGDIGCYLPNGEIEFRGRNDHQVKLHGHRIELGEIQHILEQHANVSQALVILNDERTEIIAFVKERNREDNSMEKLKRYLAEVLPGYMVPSEVMLAENFPLTSNGKLDRKQIRDMLIQRRKTIISKETYLGEVSDLQNSLIHIWKEITSGIDIRVEDNFYDLGADSLILAQMATKIRERTTNMIPFDALLREMIYKPTILALASYIEHEVITKTPKESITKEKVKDTEIAFVRDYGGDLNNGLRVIFHGALGSYNRFYYLASRLIELDHKKVIGIGIKDVEKYCAMKSSQLIPALSREYAKLIAEYGVKEVQLIGYCFGGVLGLEVANRLNEDGRITVSSLSILDSLLLPAGFIVEDELLMEMMFLDNIPVSFADINMPSPQLYEQIIVREAMKKTVIKPGFLEHISGSVEEEKLGEFFRKISGMEKERRFKLYAKLCEKNTGTEMPMEMIKSLYRVCITTFDAMHYDICPYFGVINYFYAQEGEGGFKNMVLETWKNLAIDEFKIIKTPGDHYSCVEDKGNAECMAELIYKIEDI